MSKNKNKNKIIKYNNGGKMSTGNIMNITGNALDTIGNFIPQDNDNYGISKTGHKISSGIQSGLGAAADVANSIPGGQIVGGVLKGAGFLTKGITSLVDFIKERRNPKDKRWDVEFSAKNDSSDISFGNEQELLSLALGGFTKKYENGGNINNEDFKQYQAPSHDEGGQYIDVNKNPTLNPNKAVAEIEKKENSYKDYIFSDTLPYKSNITFAKQAKKINDKYKDREDIISKNSLDLELTELMKKNEMIKQQFEQKFQQDEMNNQTLPIMKNGGNIIKAKLGLDLSDPEYFTKLMQQKGFMNYGDIGPNEDRSTLGPLFKNPDYNGVSVPVPDKSFFTNNINKLSDDLLKDKPSLNPYNIIPKEKITSLNINDTDDNSKNITPLEMAGFGIKGVEMLGHAIQAFKKPDLVKPVYNQEENRIKNIMSNRKIDNQDILNELELQNTSTKQAIADNSTSVGSMMSNLQKLHANNASAISKTVSQEQQLNNTYRGEEAHVLNNLGQQKVQADTYAEGVNAKSKANVQMQRDKFLKESIGGLGDYLLKKDAVNKENNFQMNVLKQKGINFTVNDDWKSFSKAGIDLTKFDGEIESEQDVQKRKDKIEDLDKKLKASGVSDTGREQILSGYKNKYIK